MNSGDEYCPMWDAQTKAERTHDALCDDLKSGDEDSALMIKELQDGDALYYLLDWASRGYTGLDTDALKAIVEKAVKIGADDIMKRRG